MASKDKSALDNYMEMDNFLSKLDAKTTRNRPKKKDKAVNMVGWLGMVSVATVHNTAKHSILVDSLREGRKRVHKEKEKNRTRSKKLAKKRRKLAKQKYINFDNLDQRGKPLISFEPNGKERARLLEILSRGDESISKARVLDKLRDEYARIYTRYRRMVMKVKGQVGYSMDKSTKRSCAKAAMLCLQYSVTPRQVMEYWHANIRHFVDAGMKIPPVYFLTSPTNIDTVSCAVLSNEASKSRKWRSGDFDKRNGHKNLHSFSDSGKLNNEMRSGLESAGFDLGGYNDRYLLTIQNTAIAIASGAPLFVSASIKPMVDWAVNNLYQEFEDEV